MLTQPTEQTGEFQVKLLQQISAAHARQFLPLVEDALAEVIAQLPGDLDDNISDMTPHIGEFEGQRGFAVRFHKLDTIILFLMTEEGLVVVTFSRMPIVWPTIN